MKKTNAVGLYVLRQSGRLQKISERLNVMSERGITLITLVITICVLLILAGTAIYFGTDAIQSSKLTTFTTEMKMMQSEVDSLLQKKNQGDQSVNYIGKGLEEADPIELENAFNGANETEQDGYRYYDKQTIEEQLGLQGINQEFLVNISKRKVISLEGLKYNKNYYYTLEQLPDGMMTVEYVNDKTGNISFDVEAEPFSDGWILKVQNIKYPGKYVKKGTTEYQKEGQGYWTSMDNDEAVVKEQGIYNIRVTDAAGNSSVKTKKIMYVKDDLMLYYDGIFNAGDEVHNSSASTWTDLSGNGHNGKLMNFNSTTASGWQDNSIKCDGVDDWIDTGLDAASTFTSDSDFTIAITFKANKVTSVGAGVGTQGDSGILLGAGYYGGYGFYWVTDKTTVPKFTTRCFMRNAASQTSLEQLCDTNEKLECVQTYSKTNNSNVLYINGEKISSSTSVSSGAFQYELGNIGINKAQIAGGSPRATYLDMNVYSAKIYNRALTQEEVEQNHLVEAQRYIIY